MSREDELRAMREARFEARAKRALGSLEPKPVTEIATKPATKVSATKPTATKPISVTGAKGGRPRIGDRAMTSTERSQRRRDRILESKSQGAK
jgi:hypothetical protein